MKVSLLSFIFLLLLLVPNVLAHCPLCTAATGAAVAVTRWYGLDDSIVGVFVGGMIVVTGLWINNVLKNFNKGKEYLQFQSVIVLFISFIITIATLYFANLVGPNNPYKIFGIDRILFGSVVGIVASFVAFGLHDLLRMINRNKNYLPYQSIFIQILLLATSSSILFLVM